MFELNLKIHDVYTMLYSYFIRIMSTQVKLTCIKRLKSTHLLKYSFYNLSSGIFIFFSWHLISFNIFLSFRKKKKKYIFINYKNRNISNTRIGFSVKINKIIIIWLSRSNLNIYYSTLVKIILWYWNRIQYFLMFLF